MKLWALGKMRKILILTAISWSLILLISSHACALVQPIPLEELVYSSDAIIVGRVISVSSQWDEEHKNIVSFAVVKSQMVLKGGLPPGLPIVVEYRGGIADGIEMMVSDEVKLSPDKEVVLFLRHSGDGLYRVNGRFQGKYPVLEDESGVSVVVSPLFIDGYDVDYEGFDSEDGRMLLFDFICLICRFL